jgi:hypothetical protein
VTARRSATCDGEKLPLTYVPVSPARKSFTPGSKIPLELTK